MTDHENDAGRTLQGDVKPPEQAIDAATAALQQMCGLCGRARPREVAEAVLIVAWDHMRAEALARTEAARVEGFDFALELRDGQAAPDVAEARGVAEQLRDALQGHREATDHAWDRVRRAERTLDEIHAYLADIETSSLSRAEIKSAVRGMVESYRTETTDG